MGFMVMADIVMVCVVMPCAVMNYVVMAGAVEDEKREPQEQVLHRRGRHAFAH